MGPKVDCELIFSGEIRCLCLWIRRVPKGCAEFALVDAPRASPAGGQFSRWLMLRLEVAATQGEVDPHPRPLPHPTLPVSDFPVLGRYFFPIPGLGLSLGWWAVPSEEGSDLQCPAFTLVL